MAKRRIIYESEDEDVEDKTKKSRTEVDDTGSAIPLIGGAGARRSDHVGKGNGGRLAQMQQFERVQMEQSKRRSRIDMATQGEDINPMAPSSQVDGEYISRKSRVSTEEVVSRAQEQAAAASLQPEFTLALPGQQFGFRIPDTASQPEGDTRAPTRARFSAIYSQASSKGSAPPSSQGSSLFSNGGKGSTVATSHASSICSSTGNRLGCHPRYDEVSQLCTSSHVDDQHEHPSSSRAAIILRSAGSLHRQSTEFQDFQPDAASPDLDNEAGPRLLQIDEASPSEDERIAEAHLHGTEYPRRSGSLNNEGVSRLSPHSNSRSGTSHDNDDRSGGASMDHQGNQGSARTLDDRSPSQARLNSRDVVARMDDQHDRVPDIDVIEHSDQPSRHTSRSHDNAVPGEPQPCLHTSYSPPSSTRSQTSESILSVHRRCNRAPRLPSNSQLLAARQRQQTLPVGEPSNDANDQGRPFANVPTGLATDRADPWQLQYYDPPTHDVIERAKQFSHCDAASIDPFPTRALFNAKAIEYIDEAIAERRSHGMIVLEGWWPQNSASISRLLWEDLGNWRSSLRKKACTFVTQRYQWDPENRRDQNIQIAKNLLGNGGLFLKDGVDAQGHANNLAHPALSGLVVDFFYTGSTLVSKLFPEVFAAEVPRVTVALTATALKVALDEVASGQGEVNFRVNTYSPVYAEIFGLMSKCDTSPIHCAKTSDLRKRWAQLGSNGASNQDPVGGCGFDVDLD